MLERVNSSSLRVDRLGIFPEKDHMIQRVFDCLSFSLILHGKGEMADDGTQYAIESPCMLIHPKGKFFQYSPIGRWHEVSIAYVSPDEEDFLSLLGQKIAPAVIKINDVLWVMDMVEKIQELLPFREHRGMSDQIDTLCSLILTHVIFDSSNSEIQSAINRIAKVRSWFESHYNKSFNIDQIAIEFGFSPCDFRKTWQNFYKCSPKEYINHLRIAEAERLLKDTNLPIKAVAEVIGFPDQRYFSTWFKKYHKKSPGQFKSEEQ